MAPEKFESPSQAEMQTLIILFELKSGKKGIN